MPLRWSEDDNGRTTDVALGCGWFRGPGECARTLMSVAPLELVEGGGFGGGWPLLMGAGWTIAPALPVAVGEARVVASDGEYRRDGPAIWREAGGVEERYLTTESSQAPPGESFALLWFGDSERFTVRAGKLEIEDLFGMLCVPATRELLDRILIRAKKIDPAILSSLRTTDQSLPQTIEVRRQALLCADARWRNPSMFLTARADIESARVRGDSVEVRSVGGATAIFNLEESEDGWCLTMDDGFYVFTEIRLERRAATLSVRATLDGGLDGMAPGMRGRLIFDLRSDLVALG